MSAPQPGDSAAVARRLAPQVVGAGVERPVTVDQTNRSVVVDEAVVVKWLVPPVEAPHPAAAVLAHLREVGFAEMPPFFGLHEVGGLVEAVVTVFLPGALDGWDWMVDDLTGWVDGSVDRATVVAGAAAVGSLGARLHVSLSTPSAVIPEPVVDEHVTSELWRCTSLLDTALGVAGGEAAEVLHACAPSLRELYEAWPRDGSTPAMRLHGDLHVGQVLRAQGRLVVTDFDGNPLLDAAERHLPRPPAVDVASLVQSVDHAGRVAQRRRPDTAGLEPLITEATAACLDAYRHGLAAAGRSHLLDDRLLAPLRAAQELHEVVYAARHLPRWAYVPTATLRSMFLDARADEPGA